MKPEVSQQTIKHYMPIKTNEQKATEIAMKNAIKELTPSKARKLIVRTACELGIPLELHIDYIFEAIIKNPDLAIPLTKKQTSLSAKERIIGWVKKFKNGYNNRISQRHSNPPGTKPDPAVTLIVESALRTELKKKGETVIQAHRLAMGAENILGLLLEEFLSERLSAHGWAMAWGETIRSVDFCSKDGKLLQIKNRSNSENSSSSKVRKDKKIMKWFRVNANSGVTMWDKLQNELNISDTSLSEEAFHSFIEEKLQINPKAIGIDSNNSWAQDNLEMPF